MKIDEIKKDKRIRLTQSRIELLKILTDENRPVCYEELKHRITMNKATFYRNVAKFVEEGIVSTFESNDKKRYFEIISKMHPHFICNDCQTITCVSMPNHIALKGYHIESIILKGICKACLSS